MKKPNLILCILVSLLLPLFGYAFNAISSGTQGHDRNIVSKRKLIELGKLEPVSASIPAKTPLKSISGDEEMFGYLLYDGSIFETGMCAINPTDLSLAMVDGISAIEYYPWYVAGAYADGLYYYYGCDDFGEPYFFASLSLDNGAHDVINDFNVVPAYLVSDLTYDYSSGTMYGVATEGDESAASVLVTVDLATGQMQKAADLSALYYSIASTYSGELYGISQDGDLCSIDSATGECNVVFNTGLYPTSSNSMDFDHETGLLYWLYIDDSWTSCLVEIDVEAHQVTNKGELGTYAQVSGLYIPFFAGNTAAPDAPTEFALNANADGELAVQLSWVNPTATISGETLAELSSVDVYRNDELIHTFTDTYPGASMTYEDQPAASAMMKYSVIATNADGSGRAATDSVFVGHDVPAAIGALTVTLLDANTAQLSWEAPATGSRGGWIDVATLAYDIYRYPGDIVVAEGVTDTQYIESGITALNNYYYEVVAHTADGYGVATQSATVTLGNSISVPFSTSFAEEEQNLWTIIDVNADGTTWNFNKLVARYVFDNFSGDGVFYFGTASNSTDEWLISPLITMEEGSYEVTFDKRIASNGETVTIEIAVGNSTDDPSQFSTQYTAIISNYSLDSLQLALPQMVQGNHAIGLHITGEQARRRLLVTDFSVNASTASRVTGVVTAYGNALEGCTVSVISDGNQVVAQAVTDATGNYTMPYVAAGEYQLRVTHTDYDVAVQTIDLTTPQRLQADFALTVAETSVCRGVVVDEKDNRLSGVAITATSVSHKYSTTTDSNGNYAFDEMATGDYTIEYFKNSYEAVLENVDVVAGEETVHDVTLLRKVLPPSQVAVTGDGAVEWAEPVEYASLRYDSGIPCSETFGFGSGSYYAVVGTVFRQPSRPVSISWFTVNDGYDDHNSVNLFLFAVDEYGNPTNTLLYSADDIENIPGEWMTYHIPETINCPNGFVAALSVTGGYLTLGADNCSDPDYPFQPNTYVSTSNYESIDFYYLEGTPGYENDHDYNFMIRAEVEPTGLPLNTASLMQGTSVELGNDALPFLSKRTVKVGNMSTTTPASIYPAYNIYRLPAGEEDNRSAWSLLNNQPIEGFSYNDVDWDNLPQGYYRYAVEAVYTGDRVSEAAFTERLGKDVTTTLSLSLISPVDDEPVADAYATVASGGVTKRQDAVDGSVTFDTLEKGFYLLTVYAAGCKQHIETIDLSTDNAYMLELNLEENIVTPYNLQVSQDGMDVKLTWNNFEITDDFEGDTAFEINSPGTVGWHYIDGDQSSTGAFVDSETGDYYEFDNMFSPMAFMVFNPSLTIPSLSSDQSLAAHSGEQYLITFVSVSQNDDYIISPELSACDDIIFSFYANSYTGGDRVSVGYSTTGLDAADFVWVAQDVYVSNGWKQYSYEMPAGTRHAALRCTGCASALLVDDMAISSLEGATAQADGLGAHSYTIQLDGETVAAEYGTNSYTFANLAEGEHVASVGASYASGDSEVASFTFTTTSGMTEAVAQAGAKYDAATKVITVATGCNVRLFGTSGILYVVAHGGETVSVSNLPAGVYLLEVSSNHSTTTTKLIIR